MGTEIASKVSDADLAYYNGSGPKITTESSTLISSSPYLNHPELRSLIAQEMLRRNGADLPNTAYIPNVVKIMMELEDYPKLMQLFEEEKARLPEFKNWLEGRKLSNFTVDEVKGGEPGTLRAVIYDFLAHSGYNIDHFYQGMEIQSDFDFYLKERTHTHDIEHMITGFETDHCGEIALLAANLRATCKYFKPELAAFFLRTMCYLRAKTYMKSSLFYPESLVLEMEAEDIGAAQGRNWKYPLFLVPYRDYLDWKIVDLREELGITAAPPSGYWKYTTALSEDPRSANDDHGHAVAAE
ncbi:Coq4 family protein [Flavisphingomonas formosensis]|uniref:Coq4 family protein n=1 Tax=Flavisphingomonas formosensis TaxID=861534 RepID=UPI0012F75399|nr:Coq4 family protein [Sphingomonas formosensis]